MSTSLTLQSCPAEMRPSETTVVRTGRAAGFDGFQDVKYHVLRELTVGGEWKSAVNGEAHYGSDIGARVSAVDAALDEAAALLCHASRVVLGGVAASHGIALILPEVRFTRHKQALPIHDADMPVSSAGSPADGRAHTGTWYHFHAPVAANTRPVGQWNGWEIFCREHDYLVRINGKVVNTWTDTTQRTTGGFIGLQNCNDEKIVRHCNPRLKDVL